MKNRSYKDFKTISSLLYKMEKSIINSTKETYPHYKELCQTIIKHINDDIIELMKTYLDPEIDEYALNILDKVKKNLITMNLTVFDRIDPSTFDDNTYLLFQHKIITWIGQYKDKVSDLMMNYYTLCDYHYNIALGCIATNLKQMRRKNHRKVSNKFGEKR